MVTPLRVPRRYEAGLAMARDLSDESARELLSALREAPQTVNEISVSSAVASKVTTIPSDDVDEIVPALLYLYSMREISQASSSEVAEGVARGMEESGSSLLRLSPEDRAPFAGRLVELLSVGTLSLTARAGNLLLDHERWLREARILTDIRPVFEPDNPKAPPRGAVVVHTLKITYYDAGAIKDFYVAFDTSDVRTLTEQLERASSKGESLESVLESAKVPYIDAE